MAKKKTLPGDWQSHIHFALVRHFELVLAAKGIPRFGPFSLGGAGSDDGTQEKIRTATARVIKGARDVLLGLKALQKIANEAKLRNSFWVPSPIPAEPSVVKGRKRPSSEDVESALAALGKLYRLPKDNHVSVYQVLSFDVNSVLIPVLTLRSRDEALRNNMQITLDCLPPGGSIEDYSAPEVVHRDGTALLRRTGKRDPHLDTVALVAVAVERAGGPAATPAGLAHRLLDAWGEERKQQHQFDGRDIGNYHPPSKPPKGKTHSKNQLASRTTDFGKRLDWARQQWARQLRPSRKAPNRQVK